MSDTLTYCIISSITRHIHTAKSICLQPGTLPAIVRDWCQAGGRAPSHRISMRLLYELSMSLVLIEFMRFIHEAHGAS